MTNKKPTMAAPYFVIQVGNDGSPSISPPLDTAEDAIAYASAPGGIDYTAYAVGTIAAFDRTSPTIADVNAAAMALILKMTTNRGTSSPQCIPISLFRKAQKLQETFVKITGEKS